MRDLHLGQGLVAAGLHLFGRQAELKRAKGHVVQYRWTEQLDVGVLKHQAHLTMEAKRLLAGRHRSHVLSERLHGPFGGAHDAVKHLQQRRLARAVGAQQRHLLAGADLQVDAVQRHVAAVVQVADAGQLEDGFAQGRR
jgi:fructose-1,6-bisphosphatase